MTWKKITQTPVIVGQPINSSEPTRRYDQGKRKNKGKDRVCTEAACGTILSIYNPSDFCAIHVKGDGE